MFNKYFQHGCVALGAFIALASGINGWIVFIFVLLFWSYKEDKTT